MDAGGSWCAMLSPEVVVVLFFYIAFFIDNMQQ
jgi:hypothetical protein